MLKLILPIAVLALAACTTEPAPAAPACRADLADAVDGLDAAFDATGSCASALTLSLWVAVEKDGGSIVWVPAAEAPLAIEGSWGADGDAFVRDVTLRNTGSAAATVHGLLWTGTLTGGSLQADRMLHNGYQSWNYMGIETIPADNGELFAPTDGAEVSLQTSGGQNELTLEELPGLSWWWTAVGAASDQALIAGADGGTVWKTYFLAERDESGDVTFQIAMGLTGDPVALDAGSARSLDGLYLRWDDIGKGLDAYAETVAAKHPPTFEKGAPLAGWGSWNLYYTDISAPTLREDLAWLTSELDGFGLDTFLLDDGYLNHWGSWSASVTFGTSLANWAGEVKAAGMNPAIWLAPMYVDVKDPVVTAHPEWFVRREDGSLRTFNNFGPDHAALDITHPDARAFFLDQLTALWDAGYRIFKIDFLFGAAIEGQRQTTVTTLESYQLWMKAIRDAVPEAHLIGCGAPMLPSVGWVDSMRTGPDIAFVVLPDNRYPFLAAQARHTAYRPYTDKWWILDADVVLLRGTNISDAEAWTHVVSAMLSGGNYLLGDARQSTEARLAMALRTGFEQLADGVAARPVDWMATVDPKIFGTPPEDLQGKTALPHVWEKTDRNGVRWTAVYGWEPGGEFAVRLDSTAVEVIPPADLSGTATFVKAPAGPIAVDRHAVRLFRSRP